MERVGKNIKVDAYDFFGYLLPGLLLAAVVLVSHVIAFNSDGLRRVIIFSLEKIESFGVSHYITLILLLVCVSYVFGHFVSSLSSFLFEKFMVNKILGYPYESLILDEPPIKSHESLGYKLVVIFFYCSVLLFVWSPKSLYFDIFGTCVQFMYPCLYLFGFGILVSIVFNFFATKGYKFAIRISSCIDLIIVFVVKFIGSKSLPVETIKEFKSKYKRIFNIDIEKSLDSDVFWSTYWYVTSKNAYFRAKIDKWMVLYSFMRNLACSCLLSSLILTFSLVSSGKQNSLMQVHCTVMVIFSIVFAIDIIIFITAIILKMFLGVLRI